MNPDEIVVAITIVLLLMYGGSQVLTWWRKQAQAPVSAPRRAARASPPRAYQRRSRHDRQQEGAWIKVGLEAGIEAAFMARALKGNPSYNRRRVRAVAALLEATKASPTDEEPSLSLEPQHASL